MRPPEKTEDRGLDDLIDAVTVMEKGVRLKQALDNRVESIAGISFLQATVLAAIKREDGKATVSGLAAQFDRAVHTMTSAVNGLERGGFAERVSIRGEDRRIVRIRLTSRGEDALVELIKRRREVFEEVSHLGAGKYVSVPEYRILSYLRPFKI